MISRKRVTLQVISRATRFALFALVAASSFASCSNRRSNDNSTGPYQKTLKANNMKTVLIIGMNPQTIDFTNPELPKGLNKEMIERGTKATLEQLRSIGYEAELFLLDTGTTDLSGLVKHLNGKSYGGIVVGNGIRGLASNFILFEQIINVVHANAPGSKIIFNSLPTNTDEAVKRWL